MKIMFIIFIGMIISFLFLQEKVMQKISVLPVFLLVDTLANEHQTNTIIVAHSKYLPTQNQIDVLKKDYNNLWAHLNHVYATNDIAEGKEYFTENWFKQLCKNYEAPVEASSQRLDIQHELHIEDWATDALVCTAIDSNVIFKYQYLDKTETTTKANIAVALLFQGDHWCIDAMRIMDEKIISNK